MLGKFKSALFAVAALFAISLCSFAGKDNESLTYKNESAFAGVSDNFQTRTTLDTVTNTGTATRSIPYSFANDWQAGISIKMTNLSGTRSVKCVLDESMSASGTDWAGIDSTTVTGTSTLPFQFRKDHVYGRRQRLRFTGTTGTMSVQVQTVLVYKRKQ